jgi:hypothetical protein
MVSPRSSFRAATKKPIPALGMGFQITMIHPLWGQRLRVYGFDPIFIPFYHILRREGEKLG